MLIKFGKTWICGLIFLAAAQANAVRLNSTFERNFGFSTAIFSVTTDEDTQIAISELNHSETQLSFVLTVNVNCSAFDVTATLPGMAPQPIDISETICVAGPQSRAMTIDLPATPEELPNVVVDTILAALLELDAVRPTGFNFATPFGRLVETICPGTTAALQTCVATMAYEARTSEIAILVRDRVMAMLRPAAPAQAQPDQTI